MPREITAYSNPLIKRVRNLREKRHRREEGLFLGSTSGINVAAAVRVALELGRGHTIVTILCDGGAKYQSRLFNREWLEQKGLAPHAGNPEPRPPITLEKALVT